MALKPCRKNVIKRELTSGDLWYGLMGTPSQLTYEDSTIMHVGDIVQGSGSLSIVIEYEGSIGIMGWHLACREGITNGVLKDYYTKFELVKKYYDTSESDFPIRGISTKPFREIKEGHDTSFGIIGTPTMMVCKKGNLLYVGDIVKVVGKYDHSPSLIVSTDSEFVMGWKGCNFENGHDTNYGYIELIKRHYDVEDGKYYDNHLTIAPMYESVEIIYPKEPSQPKSKLSQITVPIKVDVQPKPTKPKQSQRPIIEEDKSEIYIYIGSTVVYINHEWGGYGVSTCGSKDIYDKEIGKAIAYYRANHSEK